MSNKKRVFLQDIKSYKNTRYGISHVILPHREKMQRIITERCIRYSTKVGLSPASTTTLLLLDTKIGISHVILPAELLREENATQNRQALHSLFHQGTLDFWLDNTTTAIGCKNWLNLYEYQTNYIA